MCPWKVKCQRTILSIHVSLGQWFSTFPVLQPFTTVPHVVPTPKYKIISLLLHKCNVAIVNCNVIFGVEVCQPGCTALIGNHYARGTTGRESTSTGDLEHCHPHLGRTFHPLLTSLKLPHSQGHALMFVGGDSRPHHVDNQQPSPYHMD